MLILFLKSSNHKMAITILGSMYNAMKENQEYTEDSFVEIVKLVAGYYFLWRSVFSNSGLDSTYRDFFKNNKFSIEAVREHFKKKLSEKEIDNVDAWKEKARNFLKYATTGNDVIRLALLAASHDTIPDESNRGLIKQGRENTSNYLCLEKWSSDDLRTIEHIAPQTNKNGLWDEELYDVNIKSYQAIGNLTLLPQDLNSSAGNKGWKEKLLYYQCVAETDPDKIVSIKQTAAQSGIELKQETVELLQNSSYNSHLSSISSLTSDDVWNKDLVDRRTEAILDIIWRWTSKWIWK